MTRPLFFVLWLLLGGASLLPAAGREGIAPDSTVRIEPQELLPDTYSPLRDRYPRCTPISGTVTATGVRR
jgi:hypothetical protein